jgi:hypothetical protein
MTQAVIGSTTFLSEGGRERYRDAAAFGGGYVLDEFTQSKTVSFDIR